MTQDPYLWQHIRVVGPVAWRAIPECGDDIDPPPSIGDTGWVVGTHVSTDPAVNARLAARGNPPERVIWHRARFGARQHCCLQLPQDGIEILDRLIELGN